MTSISRFFVAGLTVVALLLVPPGSRATTASPSTIDWTANKFTVVFLLLHDCPISNAYAPELIRIADKFRAQGFGFVAAFEDPDFSQVDAEKHAREYRFTFPVVVDPKRELPAATETKIVPEAVVFNAKREILYRGRIDDLYSDIGKRRLGATDHTLHDALTNIVAGRKPARACVPGVGCPI